MRNNKLAPQSLKVYLDSASKNSLDWQLKPLTLVQPCTFTQAVILKSSNLPMLASKVPFFIYILVVFHECRENQYGLTTKEQTIIIVCKLGHIDEFLKINFLRKKYEPHAFLGEILKSQKPYPHRKTPGKKKNSSKSAQRRLS